MNISEVEKIIRGYNSLKRRISILSKEIESLTETGISALSFSLSGKSKTNNISRPTEDNAIDNIDKKKEVKKELFVLKKQLEIIDEALNSLDNMERQVIKLKLIQKYSYEEIAEEINISVIYAKKLKRKALVKVKSIIG